MTIERGGAAGAGKLSVSRRMTWRIGVRSTLTLSIILLSAAIFSFTCAAFLAPRVSERLEPASIQPDGEGAFTLGLSMKAPWPYVVPSHPDFGLAPRDVALTEDGVPIGTLEPSHAEIRRLGGGRFDLWQGTLWFALSGSDPRDGAHAYVFSVRTRLAPEAAMIWYWCGIALVALVAVRLGRVAVLAGRSVAWSGAWAWSLRWRFRLPFFATTLSLLAALAIIALRVPLRAVYGADSYAYIEPGLRLADSQSIAGTSVRDLGYPALTYMAVRLGSLGDLAVIQLGLVLLAVACMLFVLEAFCTAMLRASGYSARQVPVLLTVPLIMVGVLYVLMLFSHNDFVLDISTIMAEAPHFLPMAGALLCFAAGWATTSDRSRILLLAPAAAASFVSTIVKPSSLIAFALCAVSLVVACGVHRRRLRSPAVVIALVLTVGFVVGLQRLDAWATARDDDFGAKVLFCNHLDVVDGHLEATTPERAVIKGMIASVFSLGPHGWPLQGFDGDQCTFVQRFSDAIQAAALSEGRTPKDWQMHEFFASVITHPFRYARHVAKQVTSFALHPIANIDEETQGHISDGDWIRLSAFAVMQGQRQADFTVSPRPWLRDIAPGLVSALKGGLRLVSSTFAVVAVASVSLALWAAFGRGRRTPSKVDAILLSVAAFTAALPSTVALSHTFDVGRYTVDILPFTLLWWWLGLLTLLRAAFRLGSSL